jgi:Domain of unknown function (DUF222)
MPAQQSGADASPGLAWSWTMDFDALIGSLAAAGLGDLGDPGDLTDAGAAERIPAGVLAGRVAEQLAPGPDLAGWLSQAPAADLQDYDLAAVAGSWRRVASWAQAQELTAVAQIASRTAARDEDIGVGEDGRPGRVPVSAAAEVALELTMSQYAAAGWTDLAVDLAWRLAATGAALASGVIDLQRARLIAEATSLLSDDAAQAVEARVLPAAGRQTPGMLRAALRRAVITADPEGAERRREDAERQAKVALYSDQETTATLAGQRLPGVHAAAAMARIKAMARAMKAAGAPGPIDLLCAQIFLGLLLGTMPPIPPAEGAPPDDDPGNPGEHGHWGESGGNAPCSGTPGTDSHGGRPSCGPGNDARGSTSRGSPGNGGWPDDTGPGSNPDGPGDSPPRGSRRDDDPRDSGAGDTGPGSDSDGPGGPPRGSRRDDDPRDSGAGGGIPADDVPPPGDADAPRDDEDYPCPDDGPAADDRDWPRQDDDQDGWPGRGPPPDWPALPAIIPPPSGRRRAERPIPGLLDVSLPWEVLAGISPAPGHLGRIGPITGAQARCLAECAARDLAAEWRIIVTDPAGRALAVTRIPRARERDGPSPHDRMANTGAEPRPSPEPGPGADPRPEAEPKPEAEPGPGAGIGLVSRVTLTISEDLLAPNARLTRPPPPGSPEHSLPGGIVARALAAATAAAAQARAAAAADAAAGGCAHHAASPGYRPPTRLRDYVIARDVTCRSPICRQPAWRGDLDHTVPFDDDGITCRCNLGGLCRTHHLVKHHPGWKLAQTVPGDFTWITPSGRAFTATPDAHPL